MTKEGAITKILHTSDNHLNIAKPETFNALKVVLDLGQETNADLITISGDLFNSALDADQYRIKARQILDNYDLPIVTIPGNHDIAAFKQQFNFGSSFHVLAEQPLECYTLESKTEEQTLNIVGVPFRKAPDDELLSLLQENTLENAVNILLLHCTLDICFNKDDFGENEGEYFPISKSTLKRLGYNFILAGHFHKKFDSRDLSSNCKFVYPGSPLSLSWKELGSRHVALVDTQLNTIEAIPVAGTFMRDIYNLNFTVGAEEVELTRFDEWIQQRQSVNYEFKVNIHGFGELGENEVIDRINQITSTIIIQENTYRTLHDIVQNPLYKRFMAKLETRDYERRYAIQTRVIQAISNLLRER